MAVLRIVEVGRNSLLAAARGGISGSAFRRRGMQHVEPSGKSGVTTCAAEPKPATLINAEYTGKNGGVVFMLAAAPGSGGERNTAKNRHG